MWTSGLNNSIFVPLGSFSWNFTAAATLTNGTWTVDAGSSGAVNRAFQTSSSYPNWNSFASYVGPFTCP
jgi:hypothetical protein